MRLPFAAYTHAVSEIENARDIQVQFAAFVESNQASGKKELLGNWKTFVEKYDPLAAKGHLSIRRAGPEEKPPVSGNESRVPAHPFRRREPEHRPDEGARP